MTRFLRKTLVAASLLVAGSASAATVEECMIDVGLARNAVTAATTFVHAKDQEGLAGKADSASVKLSKGKFADASLDLASMTAKVAELVGAAKPKLGADDGAAINAAVGTASTCVTQLMTQ